MTSPDIDDKWNDILLVGYTADAVNNFNDYPQATQDLLRHEAIETGSEFGFYILIRCYTALFRIGASLELHRLGYKKTAQ